VGNLLLQDDGVGLRLLEALSGRRLGDDVELVDGGTQGLALLGYLAGRQCAVILDAVALGDRPGKVHILRATGIERLQAHRSSTSHESNALELLALARLVGDAPRQIVIIGIEPESIQTGIGLSARVAAALPEAVTAAVAEIAMARSQCACVLPVQGRSSIPARLGR
jgi:hydrogenase maturation protease